VVSQNVAEDGKPVNELRKDQALVLVKRRYTEKMDGQVSPDEIPSILERLVDSWYAVGVAEELREQFERSAAHPAPLPGGFDDVSALQDYHRRVVSFQTRQDDVQSAVDEASRDYEHAASEVRKFLPGTSVRFTYLGERQEAGDEIFIINHEVNGQINVEHWVRSSPQQ
jgi:hypothetical protein